MKKMFKVDVGITASGVQCAVAGKIKPEMYDVFVSDVVVNFPIIHRRNEMPKRVLVYYEERNGIVIETTVKVFHPKMLEVAKMHMNARESLLEQMGKNKAIAAHMRCDPAEVGIKLFEWAQGRNKDEQFRYSNLIDQYLDVYETLYEPIGITSLVDIKVM
ncbi:MAG: hypothetical protein WCY30_02260 [Candidatus Neomarinimicrobiota bacterium]|jgi:hypothetical protein